MKVTVFLRKDHEALKALFSRYSGLGGKSLKERESLFGEIEREIMIHSQTETEIFYPALRNSSSDSAVQLVEAALKDHRFVEDLLAEIRKTPAQDKQFHARINQLFKELTEHMDREEAELFDEARKTLPELRLEELGLEMEERRKILSQLAA
jgi:hemerythrin superfamily protein